MSTQFLIQFQLDVTRIGFLMCVGIGNISSFLGLLVFCTAKLRKNSCIVFLIGYMATNLVLLDFTILFTALAGYGYDLAHQSIGFCRLRMYMSFVFSTIPSYLLVMASWDRMCVSSSNIRIRSMATRRFSLLTTLAICAFWSVFHIHAIFSADIIQLTSTRVTCNTRPGPMTTFVTYYSLIFDGLLPLILMTAFGIRTWLNVQSTNFNRSQRRERRIVSLLIIQLIVFFSLRFPTSVNLIYQEITKYNAKLTERIIIDRFILFMVVFCQFIQVSVSPIFNLLTQTFRLELRRIFHKIIDQNMQSNRQTMQNNMALSITANRERLNTMNSTQPE